MHTATLVKEHPDRSTRNDSCVQFGRAALYKLSEPYRYDDEKPPCEFMFVSSSTVMGEPETYAFAAKEDGDCLSWSELPGSEKGDASHAQVLRNMGYVLRSTPSEGALPQRERLEDGGAGEEEGG